MSCNDSNMIYGRWNLATGPCAPLVRDDQGVLMCSSALPTLLLHDASVSHSIALKAEQTYSRFFFVYCEN